MISEQKYLSRVSDVYIFIRDMVDKVDDQYINEKSSSMGSGVREIIVDPKLWINNKVPSESLIKEMVYKIVKTHSAKVRNYRKWILGYGLVLLCGIFDEYLNELLEEILDSNPKFIGWNSKPEILSRFREETIKGKFNVFTSKLNFTEDEFFDFSLFIPQIQKKFSAMDISKLIKIYKDRNKVAHTDSYVIYSTEELSDVRELFEKMIWNLSIKSRRKWNIKSEFIEIIKKYGGD